MMPLAITERHMFFNNPPKGFTGQTGGKNLRNPLIHKSDYFADAGKMVGART